MISTRAAAPPPTIGVLAVQGAFAAHARCLASLGARARSVRTGADLADIAGLILPGGESTAMRRELEEGDLDTAIRELGASGTPLLGVCAGGILLAREVRSPAGEGLGLLDIAVERNAYGRQIDSFIAEVELPELRSRPLVGVFIRAPSIVECGASVRVLGRTRGAPVWVRQGSRLACTFHPELTPDLRVHRAFLELVTEEHIR